jgi:hypothetical protein
MQDVATMCKTWSSAPQAVADVPHPGIPVQDGAEFGKIGKYYAVESMLLWDPVSQRYLADETPSYGRDTLEDFFRKALTEGLKGQELGDQAVVSWRWVL